MSTSARSDSGAATSDLVDARAHAGGHATVVGGDGGGAGRGADPGDNDRGGRGSARRDGIRPGGLHDPRILDTLFTLAVVLVSSGMLGGRPITFAAVPLLTGLAALVLLWIGWRHRRSRGHRSPVIAVAFAVIAVALFVLTGNVMSLGIQWIAVLLLVFELRVVAGIVYTAVLVAITLGLHAIFGEGVARALFEGFGVALLLGVGIEFAMLVQRAERTDAERRDALAALEAAYAEQRRRHGREQDLVLAEERARIATALHDGLGHRLTAIGMMLDFSERMRARDPERAAAEVREARAAAGEALDEMRRVVRAMHPVATNADDIASSLAAVAASFESTGLEVTFERLGAGAIDRDTGLLLLRVVQEGLTNVVRHAGASHALVRLATTGDEVRIAILDDGPSGEIVEGFGIRSLRERAADVGGRVDVDPHGGLDGGFALTVSLPNERTAAIAAPTVASRAAENDPTTNGTVTR